MDLKALKWQMIRGVLARRMIIGCLCFVLAMVIVSFTRMAYEVQINEPVLVNLDQCSLDVALSENSRMKISNVGGKNLTSSVVKELVNKKMLKFDDRALCVGEGSDSDVLTLREVGFNEVVGVYESTVSSVDFKANYFDFVLSRTVDRVPIPALLVLEIERVLRPGGIGAMLVGFSAFNMGSLVRSATPVSLLLRTSEILHVCGIGSFALIVFKKKLNNVVYFEDYKLPSECPSISRNKPFMERIEGIMDQNMLSYLPEFVNFSTRNKLIYINMGTGELGNDYPIHLHAFNVYVVDHNVSALSANVKKPGVTFVYHPGLVERHDNFGPRVNHADYFEAPLHEQRFEFTDWFKETAKDGDFVVLKMNAGLIQLKVLFELFESGAICHVDEMFIRCSKGVDCGNRLCSDCFSLFNGLRNAGVFVHRWSGD
ncbi:Methyltransferase type 11 [Artemisia annua]|uniref:Methyltransferase type 11 n=1 Tax=Artemisia annua TaxID=35608 RepID=A0A2U1PZL2_ARTAN|nr:Methyltransferase type 11 [Artemisia annua]